MFTEGEYTIRNNPLSLAFARHYPFLSLARHLPPAGGSLPTKGGAHGGFPYRCKNLPLSGDVALHSNDGEGYSLPHCRPVKKRSVVLARKTFPARSSVLGNSG